MSYAPLKVRYGTSVEPWHTLSLYYHYDTPLPMKRDYTKAPVRHPLRFIALGDGDYAVSMAIYGTLAATFAAGALSMHMMHRYHVLGMNRRVRRNRRRRR